MPRSRTMGGCANCRRHHVKCDQTRPECRRCIKHNRVCDGYTRTLIFPGDNILDSGKVRGQLFTQVELQRTSQVLLENVLRESTERQLHHLEDLSEVADVELAADGQLMRGPFGAFRFKAVASPSRLDNFAELEFAEGVNFEDFGTVPDAEDYIYDEFMIDPFDISSPLSAAPEHGPPPFLTYSPKAAQLDQASFAQDDLPRVNEPSRPLPMGLIQETIPHEAPFLLRNYHETVAACMTPVQNEKSPWNTVFLAQAKDVLATIMLSDSPGYASMCAFHAILSISAFCQRVNSTSQRWDQIAHIHRLQGKRCLQLAWPDAFSSPKKVKYKAVLIALLSMIQASAFAGLTKEAESYLLDAELLVRLRGIPKPAKSRRIRLLHHCYSFPRIFYESTSVLDTNYRQHVTEHLANVDLEALPSAPNVSSFQLGGWSELYQDMVDVKSKESGETDYHLERPGLWADTLYPDIFGIPESFLVLLSQTIRLGNELTAAEEDCSSTRTSSKDLRFRLKSLENCIIHWRDHTLNDKMTWDPRLGTETASADRRAIIRNMLEALSEALCIYFYRRIHNFHPSLLQEKVRAVRDGLLRCDQSGDFLHCTAGFSWSAFIAACEATDTAVQATFSMWFMARIQNFGWPCFSTMLEVAKKVWTRNIAAGERVSWPEVLREEGIRIFYSC